ncbi:YidB family protein [Nocardia colli]|uniref:YidB family protein n=1 Tax=Nocardia colli TaxID=2545717 RepID=UPI0035DD1717
MSEESTPQAERPAEVTPAGGEQEATRQAPWLALLVFAGDELPVDELGFDVVRLSLPQTASWIGQGENEPVDPDQVVAALGRQQLAGFAEALDSSPDDLAAKLSAKVPDFVDQATSGNALQDRSTKVDVLLALFDEVPDTVTLREPSAGISFDVEDLNVIHLR